MRAREVLEHAGRLAAVGVDAGPPAGAAVVRFDSGHRATMVVRIDDRPGIRLAELAVFVASCRPIAAAIATTGRLRGPDGGFLERVAAGSVIDVAGDGNRMEAATWHDGRKRPVPVPTVPTSSLLFDAVVRTRFTVHPYLVAEALAGPGVVIAVADGDGVGQHPLLAAPGPGPSGGPVRPRVDLMVRELAARHRPAGTVAERRCVPGIPYDLPPGWEPACAI